MKKVIGKKVLTEDFDSEVAADGLSISGRRRIQIERTISEAQAALDDANANGDTAGAARMQEVIDGLNDLLDRDPSEDEQENTEEKGEGENGNSGKDTQKDGQGKPTDDGGNDAGPKESEDVPEREDEGDDEGDGGDEGEEQERNDGEGEAGGGENKADGGGRSGRGGGGGDGDGDGEGKGGEPLKNPFKINPHGMKGGGGGGQPPKPKKPKTPEEEHKDKIKAIKKILSKLQRGEKAGALDAINKILGEDPTAKTESLQEAFDTYGKSVGELSAKEFDDIMDRAIDAINAIHHINITTKDSRVKEIERDNTALNNRDLEAEDNNNLRDERRARKAKKKEAQKYAAAGKQNLSVFKQHLWRCIKDQVADVDDEEDSWSAINKHHQNDGVLLPGQIMDTHKQNGQIPTIRVYMDCSGSFSEDDIKAEEAAMAILGEFERQKKCQVELLYFSTNLHTDYASAEAEGGTSAWDQMVEDMQAKRPTNVVIMTDSDMNGQAYSNTEKYIAPGCVWYIWNYSTAPNMLDKVMGRRGTYEFSLQ